jgi:uncharacterized SAM-binding protein YcdF (DUF218 family)
MGFLSTFTPWGMAWRIVKLFILLLFAIVVYLAVTGVQVYLTSRHSDPHATQAIVVMGAAQYDGNPSPDLEARLAEAKTLWSEHFAAIIVVTGYKEPGDQFTEAQASAAWLEQQGVPSAEILQVGGVDSWQNLSQAATALHQREISQVLLVTDGFHEDRSLAIATDVGLVASPVPAANSPISGWATVPYFGKEAVSVALGRIIGYDNLDRLHAFD